MTSNKLSGLYCMNLFCIPYTPFSRKFDFAPEAPQRHKVSRFKGRVFCHGPCLKTNSMCTYITFANVPNFEFENFKKFKFSKSLEFQNFQTFYFQVFSSFFVI